MEFIYFEHWFKSKHWFTHLLSTLYYIEVFGYITKYYIYQDKRCCASCINWKYCTKEEEEILMLHVWTKYQRVSRIHKSLLHDISRCQSVARCLERGTMSPSVGRQIHWKYSKISLTNNILMYTFNDIFHWGTSLFIFWTCVKQTLVQTGK